MTSEFHENFRRLTGSLGVIEISEQTGIDHGSISRYRSGSRQPTLDRLKIIAERLHLSADELLGVRHDSRRFDQEAA
jgi:transcriptional regulator with XRE-family HTH domain